MENEAPQSSPQAKSKMMPIAIVVVIVVIILVGIVAYTMTNKPAMQGTADEQTSAPTPTAAAMMQQETTPEAMAGNYKDGEYSAEGDYTSPGGAESMDVTLTLKNGVVTDANVVSNAERPISKQMQTKFIGGYKELVVGKKIDEINLSKVSGSSLAPKGFNDAVEKIKTEAKA